MFKTWEELSRNEQLHSEYYDFYKEVHGIRPRWIWADGGVPAYTEQEMEGMLERLAEQAKVVFAEEEARQQEAIQEFEELVESTMKHGARSREHALRWIAEAEHYNGDWDHICYHYGLPYGYFNKEAANV